MPDVPVLPEPEPKPTVTERIATSQAAAWVRYILTGDEHYGRVRRPVLFIITAIAIVLGVPVVALVALLILALTDQVVTL